ncbi:MAG TPA: TetR/AcrR family transcriptional regulator [Polyangia bacterium]|jgi:AcrR family transcriptional regulator|nr:TetR/AcrR family transcriptional regulator [Polyangia bacterium]
MSTAVPTKSQAKSAAGAGSPRERLLAAANELFYEEGVHTVGIDRVLEKAGVAKASLYSTFGSKDELVRAYLAGRHEARKARITRRIEAATTPRGRVLAVFDALEELVAQPSFRGCAFVLATAEGRPGGGVRSVCEDARAWTRTLFTDLARAAGAAHPARLAQQLTMLYDGATTVSSMDGDVTAPAAARAMAATLLDAAIERRPTR